MIKWGDCRTDSDSEEIQYETGRQMGCKKVMSDPESPKIATKVAHYSHHSKKAPGRK